MELRLKGFGAIEISNATLVDGGDILIESADGFEKIARFTNRETTDVYLAEVNFTWYLVVWLSLPDDVWDEEKAAIFHVENQYDVYKLSARL